MNQTQARFASQSSISVGGGVKQAMTEKQENILVVDDEAAIRKLLSRHLSNEGYQCQEAACADEAMGRLTGNSIDLVILDIKMPGKSGVDLLQEIKAAYPDISVIMATAINDVATTIQCMRHGAYDYVTKPFNFNDLAIAVGRAMEKRRLVLENRDYQQHLEQKVKEQGEKIRNSFLNAVTALVFALEAKDSYTNGHSQRVMKISVAIARELGLPAESIERIRLAALIHDIGKIGVKESVLNKPGKLTHKEHQHIALHCAIGERILSPLIEDTEILGIVRHHHERYDGMGYPDQLSGSRIAQGVKIVAVANAYANLANDLTKDQTISPGTSVLSLADAYDAMTSDRPYRAALPREKVLKEIRQGAGTQFDPEVVDAFMRIGEFDYPVT